MSIDDRIQFIERPIALPGVCAICGFPGGPQSDGRAFVDWGLQLEFYGAVIFCTSCFKAAAAKLGFLSYEDTQLLRRQVQEYMAEIQTLRAENDHLRMALNSINLVPHYSNSVSEPEGSKDPSGPEQGIESNTEGSPESDNGGGSAIVSSDDGNSGSGLSFIKFE